MTTRQGIDLTNQRFGRLLVQYQVPDVRSSYGDLMWHCKCDCGNEGDFASSNLRKGSTQSCGCLRNERTREKNFLPNGMAIVNRMYLAYKHGAKKREIEFHLTKDEFYALITKPCIYCGATSSHTRFSKDSDYSFNGVDRANNDLGYTVDNCVPCCKVCNHNKGTMSSEEFLSWIKVVYLHNFEG